MKKITPFIALAMTIILTACGGTSATSDSASESSEPTTSSSNAASSNPVSSDSVHEHDYEAVVTSPTCTEQGYTTYTCSCGESYVDDYVDALGHDLVQCEAKAATCTEPGWDAYETCSRCDYSTKVEIPATGVHNYVGGVCTVCGETAANGTLVEFGRYPQTCVTDESLISSLSSVIDSDNDGYIEYEGKEYLKTLGSFYDVYSTDETYYFEVEPITWKYYDGMLISEKVIDASIYYKDTRNRTIGGKTVYANNYEYSTVRAYLNGLNGTDWSVDDFSGKGFIDKAFTEEEQEKIMTTTVDNSSASIYPSGSSEYACANTEDKIFLLSRADAINTKYGYSDEPTDYDEDRVKQYTDYAMFKGLYSCNRTAGTGVWWLRSPGISDYSAYYVRTRGQLDQVGVDWLFVDCRHGLSPALKITL